MHERLPFFLLLLISFTAVSQNTDIRVLRSINSPSTASDPFFKFVSNSSKGIVVGLPLSMGIAGLITKDDILFKNACKMIAANAINLGATYMLKYSINRNRPFETYPDIVQKGEAGNPSFPSGHTSSAFATATSLVLDYPKWYVAVPAFIWAGGVGYSRMYLGLHYPSDVITGALIGAGSAFLAHKLNKWLNNLHKGNYEHR